MNKKPILSRNSATLRSSLSGISLNFPKLSDIVSYNTERYKKKKIGLCLVIKSRMNSLIVCHKEFVTSDDEGIDWLFQSGKDKNESISLLNHLSSES